jgi:hypothetical protein
MVLGEGIQINMLDWEIMIRILRERCEILQSGYGRCK